ncbi:hypothetical protein ACRALDRAFT_211265 [Sodiomyces alcalophilus JCM 7366]|uniref:uncharacterized protein n=1 Tax=Sodiomyces alcalophilus JCM 7366 TaxID=591952 RepID=UPI0039B4FE98
MGREKRKMGILLWYKIEGRWLPYSMNGQEFRSFYDLTFTNLLPFLKMGCICNHQQHKHNAKCCGRHIKVMSRVHSHPSSKKYRKIYHTWRKTLKDQGQASDVLNFSDRSHRIIISNM